MHEINVTLIIDGDGNYQLGKDFDEAQDNWDANEGRPSDGLKVYNLTLNVAGPKPVDVAATIPGKGDEPVTVTIE